ncbi:hypothetical protein CAAN1_05S02300 [[Candida] anglica]|uniref:Cytochrome b5 heme-binding domain-containing protein n=1 Tax=[Candida] anglica TaxID=148631 RepID=A0ABP0EH48_9ASCO
MEEKQGNSTPEMSPKVYTLKEVSKHESPNDLWMVIYNKVYDVTDFLIDHPGGAEVLFDCGGVDATEAFEDVAHSDDALNMLSPYYMGDLHVKDHLKYDSIRNPSSNMNPARDKSNPSSSIPTKEQKRKSKTKRKKSQTKQSWVTSTQAQAYFILIALALVGILSYLFLQKIKWSKTYL